MAEYKGKETVEPCVTCSLMNIISSEKQLKSNLQVKWCVNCGAVITVENNESGGSRARKYQPQTIRR